MGRITSAMRVLARKRAYLAAMAAAGLALLAGLLFTLTLAAAWAWAAPDPWGVDVIGPVLALVFWLPFAGLVLTLLQLGVRTYTLATSGPPPRTPAGMAGGMTGLGLSVLGGRMAKRRGPLGWLTDPWGTAAAEGLSRAVPPGHPMEPLVKMAAESQRRPPARGVGTLALVLALVPLAGWFLLQPAEPALASLALAPVLLLPLLAAVLAAALRGVLKGAWDRYLMDAMAARAEQAAYAPSFKGYEPRP